MFGPNNCKFILHFRYGSLRLILMILHFFENISYQMTMEQRKLKKCKQLLEYQHLLLLRDI